MREEREETCVGEHGSVRRQTAKQMRQVRTHVATSAAATAAGEVRKCVLTSYSTCKSSVGGSAAVRRWCVDGKEFV